MTRCKLALFITLSLALIAAKPKAKPIAWQPGDKCTLTKPVALAPLTKGKPQKVTKGEVVEVLAIVKKRARVKHAADEGFLPLPLLTKSCTPLRAEPPATPAEPPPVPTEPAPPETPPPAPAPDATPPPEPPTTAPPTGPSPAEPIPAATPSPTPAGEPSAASPTPTPPAATDKPEAPTAKVKIAVMDLRGGEGLTPDTKAALSSTISQTLDELGAFKAISSADIQQMLAMESLKQTLGCDQVSCLAEIGGAIGADYMITGTLLSSDGTWLIQLQLMNIAASRVDERVSREHKGSIMGLFEEMKAATKLSVRSILAQKSGELELVVSMEGATIRLDGTIIGTSPIAPLSVAGGLHTVRIEKDGFIAFTRDIDVKQKQKNTVQATLVPSEEFKKSYVEKAGHDRTIAYATLGAGVAALAGAGGLFYYSTSQAAGLKKDITAYNAQSVRLKSEAADIDSRKKTLGTIDVATLGTAVAGAALTTVGIILRATSDDPGKFDIMPSVTVGAGASVGVGGRF